MTPTTVTDLAEIDTTPTDTDSDGIVSTAATAPEDHHRDGPVLDGGGAVEAVAVWRDPSLLVLDSNVRENFRLEDHPELADSIASHGVLTPIIAHGSPESQTALVRDGQLRTLIAIAVGLGQVPVWLIAPDTTVADSEAQITRIFEQITVNDRRVALTDGDRAAAVALALDLGASVTRVGKALQTKREDIKQAGKVGASPTARTAIDDGQLDLEQAAVLAEYETVGDTNAVEHLIKHRGSYFNYEARLIANDRTDRRAYYTAALPWAEAGFGVLYDYPHDSGPDAELVHVGDLVDADGHSLAIDQLSPEQGWLVWIEQSGPLVTLDRETGTVLDQTLVDWQTKFDPDGEPAEGLRHVREVTQHKDWQADCFLPADRLADAGLRRLSDCVADAEPEVGAGGDAEGEARSDGVADPVEAAAARDELAARRAQQDAEAAARREQQQLENRRVRVLNKQSVAAMEVRREFVTGVLARKTPPPEAAKFVAETLIAWPGILGEYNAFETAAGLIGGAGTWRHDLQKMVETAKPARCHVLVLGLVLGALEKRTGKGSWRDSDSAVKRYLRFLQEIGHSLVPVELATVGDIDYHDIDLDAAADESATPAA
ncbi:ParB/Srx family N-terminal domain-containing protein [Nocardia asteroides]|uniref:ParB/Srx family N-terminal domain-containing protein n=1 Tax=Nocardia asteroides TaxID=1824 RepID=UPI003432A307